MPEWIEFLAKLMEKLVIKKENSKLSSEQIKLKKQEI